MLYGITTCVNYADFLVWCLPSARYLFDRLIVITSKEDKDTKRVCDFNYVECVQTDLMYKDGASFNKGLCINFAIDYLGVKDWIVHFDCDCVFPPMAHHFLKSKNWDKNCLYGVDRVDIKNWDEWINFFVSPFPQHYPGSVWAGFDVGYRVIMNGGYTPIGFFSMFHTESNFLKKPIYPVHCDNASESDIQFAFKYPADKRILIPEFFVYHLQSEESAIGANWKGRKTRRFGPNA